MIIVIVYVFLLILGKEEGKYMLNRKIRCELEDIIKEMKMNLENNYKDLAHDARKKLYTTLELYYNQGHIKEKDYNKYKKIADEYSLKMTDYHH